MLTTLAWSVRVLASKARCSSATWTRTARRGKSPTAVAVVTRAGTGSPSPRRGAHENKARTTAATSPIRLRYSREHDDRKGAQPRGLWRGARGADARARPRAVPRKRPQLGGPQRPRRRLVAPEHDRRATRRLGA